MITVRLPDGKEIDVQTDDPQAAASAGRAYLKSTRPAGYTDRRGLNAAMFQGVSLGVGDELVGATTGAGNAILGALRSPQNPMKGLQTGYAQGYRKSVDRQRAELAQYRKEHPFFSAVGETAPSFLGGGAVSGALKKLGVKGLANVGASGTLSGAAYGAASGVAPDDRLKRAGEGAAVAGLTSLGVSALGRLAGHGTATLAGLAGRGKASPDDRAVRMIQEFSEKSPVTPDELVQRANKLPSQGGQVEEQLFELLGPGGLRLARAGAGVAGPSEALARDALRDRSERAFGHIVAAASKSTGVGGRNGTAQISEFLEELNRRRISESGPAYQAAYAEPIDQAVFRRDLYPLISGSDTSKEALGFAIKLADADILRSIAGIDSARRSGRDILQATRALEDSKLAKSALLAMREGRELPKVSVRALDYYQRGLGALTEKNANTPTLASAFSGAHDDFVSILKQEAPKFAAAYDGYGNNKAQEQFVELGRRVMSADEFELADALKGISGPNREAFLVGVMRAIHESAARNDTSFVRRLTRDKLLRATLSDALGGEKKAKSFFSRIARTAELNANQNFVLSGSRTAPLAEDIQALTDGQDELAMVGRVIDSGGRIDNVLLESLARNYTRNRKNGLNDPRINEALGRRIFQPATPARAKALADELRTNPLVRLEADINRRKARAANLTDQLAVTTSAFTRDRRNEDR